MDHRIDSSEAARHPFFLPAVQTDQAETSARGIAPSASLIYAKHETRCGVNTQHPEFSTRAAQLIQALAVLYANEAPNSPEFDREKNLHGVLTSGYNQYPDRHSRSCRSARSRIGGVFMSHDLYARCVVLRSMGWILRLAKGSFGRRDPSGRKWESARAVLPGSTFRIRRLKVQQGPTAKANKGALC